MANSGSEYNPSFAFLATLRPGARFSRTTQPMKAVSTKSYFYRKKLYRERVCIISAMNNRLGGSTQAENRDRFPGADYRARPWDRACPDIEDINLSWV
jgi:hypothetical protein